MSPQVRRWGSFTILSGLGGTLVAGLLAWVFSTTLENKVQFTPLIDAIDKLAKNVNIQESRNTQEHKLIVKTLDDIAAKISVAEVRINHLESNCDENRQDIKHCECK